MMGMHMAAGSANIRPGFAHPSKNEAPQNGLRHATKHETFTLDFRGGWEGFNYRPLFFIARRRWARLIDTAVKNGPPFPNRINTCRNENRLTSAGYLREERRTTRGRQCCCSVRPVWWRLDKRRVVLQGHSSSAAALLVFRGRRGPRP